MKTKQAFAEEAKAKYLTKVRGTATNLVVQWSKETHDILRSLEQEVEDLKDAVKKAEVARSKARVAYRKDSNVETHSQWHESVAMLKSRQAELQNKRIEKKESHSLSELLAKELKRRRDAHRSPNGLTMAEQESSKQKKRKVSKETKGDTFKAELCPFCFHGYTVRDGTYLKLDAMGEPMQLWKCQCREMAPPCRNCPKCKDNPEIMALDVDDQLSICREKEACEICSCECPGGGKWIQGDEKSREKYRKKAIERHKKLSGIFNSIEDGGVVDRDMPKRLPADLKDQLEAAHALLKVQGEEEEDCQSKNCVACKNNHQ